jgi:hypothetical protein
MAFTSYAELKTAIADWLHRSDLTSRIPDFISLAEAKINRNLALPSGEVDASLVMVPGSRYVALTSDFNTPIALWIETYLPRRKLIPMIPSELPVNTALSAAPNYWAVDGDNLAFDCLADQAYSLTLRYAKNYQLSDIVTTNYILQNYPDIYLYGALLQSIPFTSDMSNAQTYSSMFEAAMMEASKDQNKQKGIAALRTEIAPMRSERFNINRGY